MWYWHKTVSKEYEGLWQERVSSLPGAVISEGFKAERINVSVYTESAEEALVLQACYGGKAEVLEDMDWVAATAPQNQPPLLIRDRIVITTSDRPEDLNALRQKYPKRLILTFPAEMAFGTGNHATTSTCLRLLCDYAKLQGKRPWSLTDIGCGTGVLALAGLRLGARRAISFDFDPKAVEVARRNINRNGGAEQLQLFQADVFEWTPQEGEQADIVLANLFSTVLQQAFPRIIPAMKPDGVLVISGILRFQEKETLAAAQDEGLRVSKVIRKGKWSTAQLTIA